MAHLLLLKFWLLFKDKNCHFLSYVALILPYYCSLDFIIRNLYFSLTIGDHLKVSIDKHRLIRNTSI
jgi:hypothetical protein